MSSAPSTCLRERLKLEAPGNRQAGMLNNLAGGLLERYDLTGLIADVDEAIQVLDEAISSTPADHPDRPARLSNLAIALRTRQLRRRGGRDDLDRAVAAFQEALGLTSEQAPEAAAFHANLGNALHQRHDVTGDRGDLDRAVREPRRRSRGRPTGQRIARRISTTSRPRSRHAPHSPAVRRTTSNAP